MPHLLPCRLELISHFGEIIGVQQCNQTFEVDHHHEVLVLVDLGDLAVANLPYEKLLAVGYVHKFKIGSARDQEMTSIWYRTVIPCDTVADDLKVQLGSRLLHSEHPMSIAFCLERFHVIQYSSLKPEDL